MRKGVVGFYNRRLAGGTAGMASLCLAGRAGCLQPAGLPSTAAQFIEGTAHAQPRFLLEAEFFLEEAEVLSNSLDKARPGAQCAPYGSRQCQVVFWRKIFALFILLGFKQRCALTNRISTSCCGLVA